MNQIFLNISNLYRNIAKNINFHDRPNAEKINESLTNQKLYSIGKSDI